MMNQFRNDYISEFGKFLRRPILEHFIVYHFWRLPDIALPIGKTGQFGEMKWCVKHIYFSLQTSSHLKKVSQLWSPRTMASLASVLDFHQQSRLLLLLFWNAIINSFPSFRWFPVHSTDFSTWSREKPQSFPSPPYSSSHSLARSSPLPLFSGCRGPPEFVQTEPTKLRKSLAFSLQMVPSASMVPLASLHLKRFCPQISCKALKID